MINLSKYDGIPTTKEALNNSWNSFINYPKSKGLFKSDGGFLISKKLKRGIYKNCFSIFYYSKKPKTLEYIKSISIKDIYRRLEKKQKVRDKKIKDFNVYIDYSEIYGVRARTAEEAREKAIKHYAERAESINLSSEAEFLAEEIKN